MVKIDPTAVVAVNPEDLMRCAARLGELDVDQTDLSRLADRLTQEFEWSTLYGVSVTARLLAWGRYLADPQADRRLAPVLTLIAAASAPITDERGFEPSLLEHSAGDVLKQVAFADGRFA